MTRTGRDSAGQGGYSLIEALVVLVLVSVVVLTFALGLQTSVTADGRTNREQRMNLALTSFAEGMRRVTVPEEFWDCVASFAEPTIEEAYMARFLSLPVADRPGTDSVTTLVTEVAYWTPVEFTDMSTPGTGEFGSTCVPGAGAVRLQLQVELGGERLRGEVIKRDPESPTP